MTRMGVCGTRSGIFRHETLADTFRRPRRTRGTYSLRRSPHLVRYGLCDFLPQTRAAVGTEVCSESCPNVPERCPGVLAWWWKGFGRGGGHGVSLQARPPCGERGIRLRLIQRLFKYHKWSAVTSKIATRPVCVLLPDIVGDGRV